jgi:heme exporter protein C
MIDQDSTDSRNPDRISGIAVVFACLAALGFYFLFYAPAIDRSARSGVLPANEILWLELHISVYGMSYLLYFTGLLLAAICFLGKVTTRFPWIESATVAATVFAVVGLVTGVLFSKPAWNAWWVWDPKHVVALLNTLVLLGIAPIVVLTRSFPEAPDRNLMQMFLLFIAVALCSGSLLAGVLRNIHPQWFPSIFLR